MRDAFELTDQFECFLKLAMAFGREFLVDAVRQTPGNIITESLNGATRSSGIWPFLFTGRFLYFTNWCPHGIEEPVYAMVSFQRGCTRGGRDFSNTFVTCGSFETTSTTSHHTTFQVWRGKWKIQFVENVVSEVTPPAPTM